MAESLELAWVGFGDIVRPATTAGEREPHFVMHACEQVSKAYYCETHDQQLANLGNLVMHLESGGVHRIAIWCPKHRTYEAPEPSQVEGCRQLEGRRQMSDEQRFASREEPT